MTQLLRYPDVHQITQLSRDTLSRLEAEGQFPQRRRVGRRAVAWLAAEVQAWLESRQCVTPSTSTSA